MDERAIAEERQGYRTLKLPRDDRGPLSRPHLLSPRRASDTTLAPLHLLQNKRRGSITDPSFHAGSSSAWRQPDLPRRSLDSPQGHHRLSPRPPHVDYSRAPRAAGPPPSPARHWSQDEVHTTRMDIDEPVRQRRQTLPNQLAPLMEPPTLRESPLMSSSLGHKRKMSGEDVRFPRSDATENGREHATSTSDEPSLPSLKRRGSVTVQPMAHLSISERRDSLSLIDSPPPDAQGGQWWRPRTDSNASSHTHPGPPPPPFSPEQSSRGPLPAGMAPFAWPSRPPPPGLPHMSPEADAQIVPSYRPSYYTSSPPGPPPPMPPPYGHDRRMSAPSGLPAHSPSLVERNLRSRSRPSSRSSEQALSPLLSEARPAHHVGDPDDSGGSGSPLSKGLTPYSRSPELRVSHKLAERKRRKEMKDLFDELRDQLPADRGMKSSKWEILSKAVDYIASMKRNQQDMSRELEALRQELDNTRKYAASGTPLPTVSTFPAFVPPSPPSRVIPPPSQDGLRSSPEAIHPSESALEHTGLRSSDDGGTPLPRIGTPLT